MASNTVQVSVVIPVFNRCEMVKEAIESVLAQSYSDHEIIVVDDGSTDNTPNLLQRYGMAIRVIAQANKGPEAARNLGAAAAVGKYIVFLDSDDIMLPWALGTYMRIISRWREPSMIVGRLIHSAAPGAHWEESPPEYIRAVGFSDYFAKDRPVDLSNSGLVIKHSDFKRSGGFQEGTFPVDDLALVLRAGCWGPCVLVEEPATVVYRIHEGNSIHEVSRNIEKVLAVVKAERRGVYPGGARRRLARYSIIGGHVVNWSRKGFRKGIGLDAWRLLICGFPMVVSGAISKVSRLLRGQADSVRFPVREGNLN